MESLTPRPLLVCLNLQQDMLDGWEHDHGAALWRMRSCLHWAREHDLGVVHVHTIVNYAAAPPIRGFEALSKEVVLAKRSLSAIACNEWKRSTAAGYDRMFLLGLSRLCDLPATALDGVDHGAQVVILRDAIALEHRSVSPEAFCDLLSPVVASITTLELIDRRGLRLTGGYERTDARS